MIILNILLKFIVVILFLVVILLLIPVKLNVKVSKKNIFFYDISVNYFFNIFKLNLKNNNLSFKFLNFNLLNNKGKKALKVNNNNDINISNDANLEIEDRKDDKILKKIINSYKSHKLNYFNKKNKNKKSRENIFIINKNNYTKITSKKNLNTLKKVFGMLFKSIKFDKFEFNSIIGFDNPYITGCVLSLFSFFYFKFGDSIKVKPFFDKNIFIADGNFLCCVKLYNLFFIFLILISNKDFRKFIFVAKNDE